MAEQKHLCYNCFQERETKEGPCPYCGFDLAENERKFPVALRAGTVLNDRYIVGRVLGQGGFGITYLALDTQLNAKVAIKEFMPGEIATRVGGTTVSVMMDTRREEFTYGAERFQEEARTLAKFIGTPNIAAVTSYFDENDTSYFVMDYIEGISFKTYIANHGGKISVEETLNVMIPVLRALTAVHAEGFIHRDVTPDNIYITKDGMVKLLDFGSARYSIGDKSKSLDVILKVGYAPKEQYIRRSRQGPFTDVYSCAACFYAAITGFLPPESLERLDEDTLVPISQCGIEIPEYLDRAILKGLAVQPEDRFQNAQEFLGAIEQQQVVEVPVSGGNTASLTLEKKKAKPALIAAIAAAVVVVLGIGIAIGGGDRTTVDADGETVQLIQAEVPSITIAGQEYSTDLTELDLGSMYLTDADIEPLQYMVNLRSLDLRQNQLTDLTPLAGLTQLESLELRGNNLSDLTPLAGLTNLKTLRLGGSDSGVNNPNLQDLTPLSGLKNLEILVLPGNSQIRDLTPISGLTNLREFSMSGDSSAGAYQIADLSPLAGLTNLERLSVTINGVDSLEPLRNLKKLAYLFINGEGAYQDFSPISELTELQTLRLVGTGNSQMAPGDLQFISGLTQLKTLKLHFDGTLSLRGIEGLTALETVTLMYHNGDDAFCVDIEALSGLTNLKELTLCIDDRVLDLSPLTPLKNLRALTLFCQGSDWAKPSLTDLTPISQLTELQSLALYERNITDISPLRDLTNLQNLLITEYGDQKITDWSPVDHVPNVTKG